MKIFVKTLKGTHFEIDVKPEDTVADVKKNIETSQGQSVYPAEQQMLIHQGKILKDPTTLAESDVAENSFVVVMLSKTKAPAASQGGGSSAAAAPPSQPVSAQTAASTTTTPITNPTPTPTPTPASTQAPAPVRAPAPASPPSTTVPLVPAAAESTPVDSASPAPVTSTQMETDPYSQAASNLVAGSKMDEAVRHILDIGGGTWDRETVVRALRAAFNNPERAIEYLYSGIPEQAEALRPAAPPTQAPTAQAGDPTAQAGDPTPQAGNPTPQAGNPTPQAQPVIPSGGPNANPLNLFPQGLPTVGGNAPGNNLDFLRNSPQFRALQSMVQANPHILQPMLQELAKQNPQLMRLIQEHQADFVRLINEPPEGGGEGNPLNQIPSNVPQAIQVTPEEREAIERLEALGFDRALVLEVFFACNKNEELAANYLLDHANDFDD